MNNTRFATAIHILTLLDKNSDAWLTSEWIAGSININSAIVRKEIIAAGIYTNTPCKYAWANYPDNKTPLLHLRHDCLHSLPNQKAVLLI